MPKTARVLQRKTFRLVYYEEFRDVRAAIAREKQIKGWTRAKKNALVESRNPQWHDLIAEWEKKFGLVFQTDGRIVSADDKPELALGARNSDAMSS